MSEQIRELLEKLDLTQLQAYLDGTGQSADIKELILDFLSGDFRLDYDSLGEAVLSVLFDKVLALLPSFAVLLSITLLYGIFSQLKSGALSGATDTAVYYVCLSGMLTVLLGLFLQVLGGAQESVSELKKQMELVLPVLLTLMAASGGTVSVAVYQPAVAFLSTGIVSIISDVVFAFAAVQIVLTVVGNLSEGVRLDGFCKLFESLNKWILGISLTVFSLFLTVQGITSGVYDGVSLRALKYTINNSVPIIGGFLSGGFDLVVAGSVLIKNSLGALSIFLLAGAAFGPLMGLAAVNLLLKLTAAVADAANGEKLAAFYRRLSGQINYYTAGLLGVVFLYFVMLLLLVCSFSIL